MFPRFLLNLMTLNRQRALAETHGQRPHRRRAEDACPRRINFYNVEATDRAKNYSVVAVRIRRE